MNLRTLKAPFGAGIRLATNFLRHHPRTLEPAIRLKWFKDRAYLPLINAHAELYRIIHRHFFAELGLFPNIADCKDYNDKIQWLKLFDQDIKIVNCTDKLYAINYVKQYLGTEHLPELYQVHDSFSDIKFDELPNAFVIKTNHDSGSVMLVRNKSRVDKLAAGLYFDQALREPYGREKGEWAYAHIKPKIFVEEYLGNKASAPPPDYKFHCVDGKVRFVHYIYDRGVQTKEIVVDSCGNELGRLYMHFARGVMLEKPSCWCEMISVSQELSKEFKYVRVDLFAINGKVYVGEMTFWPMAGCYTGVGQRVLGEYLDFDRSTFKKPVYGFYGEGVRS
jgi:hypothetical protein